MLQKVVRSGEGFNLRLEARLKNAALMKARESLHLTAKEASEKMGVPYYSLLGYEGLRSYPPPATQKKICDFYRSRDAFIMEEDAFPQELRGIRVRKLVREKEIPRSDLLSLSDAGMRMLPSAGGIAELEEKIDAARVRDDINRVLSRMQPKRVMYLRLRYGIDDGTGDIDKIRRQFSIDPDELMSYSKIGAHLGCRPQNVMQILEHTEKLIRKHMGYVPYWNRLRRERIHRAISPSALLL